MSTSRPLVIASRRGAALLLLGLAAGCGRKGDLYMPDEDSDSGRRQPDGEAPTTPGPTETESLPDLKED